MTYLNWMHKRYIALNAMLDQSLKKCDACGGTTEKQFLFAFENIEICLCSLCVGPIFRHVVQKKMQKREEKVERSPLDDLFELDM